MFLSIKYLQVQMPEEEFVAELKDAYTKELDIKSKLDTKSNSMISMSGTIATLFMGFGAFLIKDIPTSKLEIIIPATIILMAEVILTTLTIRYSIAAYKLREYYYPLTHDKFIDKEDKYNVEMIETFQNATKKEFNEHLIKEYLKGIKSNVIQNNDKSNKINIAQKFFLIALSLIPVFSLLIISSKFVP